MNYLWFSVEVIHAIDINCVVLVLCDYFCVSVEVWSCRCGVVRSPRNRRKMCVLDV